MKSVILDFEVSIGRRLIPSGSRWGAPSRVLANVGLRISETYLSAKSGKFIKVRLTLTAEEFKERQGEIGGFMKHLASILGAQETAPVDH